MSQEANANFYMNHRCEPMGGELDSSNRNVPNIGRHSNSTDSFPEDHFIDDLTLKVRSLLKSWDDELLNDDLPNYHLTHDNSYSSHSTLSKEFQVGKSTVSTESNFSSSEIIPEYRISNELKYHSNDSKLNPSESFTENSSNNCKSHDISSFSHKKKVRTLMNPRENRSEFRDDKYLNCPRTSINKMSNYDVDDTLFLKKTSTPIPTVEDPLSYNDFSSSLQDVRNISNRSEKNFNYLLDKSVLESSRKLSGTERNSKEDNGNLKTDSSLNAADLYCRESSDKETERSWSEITIVAESYSESSKNRITSPIENQNDFCNANSLQPASFKKPPNVLSSSVRVKENIKNISRSANIYNKDINVSTREWKIEITDHDKTLQESDKEYQFSDFLPNSNLSDLDQIDCDTPPLSASSMASSKRLEWDNGADIGYNVADMRSKVKYRSIPRSEPEGISFINETGTNTVSSKILLPSFASMTSQDEPASMVSSHLDGLSSETSSVHGPSVMEDLLERSSSPGSLSRSDSKKSVIYNSFKNTLASGKTSSSSDLRFMQTRKNSSWPDLTLKSSVPVADWDTVSPSKILSKSDEQVGSVRCSELKHKECHFPGFTVSANNINESIDSSHLSERILPIGDYFPSELQSFSKQNSTRSISHSCKNCQSPLSENVVSSAGELISPNSGDLCNLQEGDLESYEIDSELPNLNQTNNYLQFPQQGAEGDWTNENVLNSDFSYITELPELTDYQLQSFTSKPFLLLHHDASRLKGNNFPNMVQNLFCVGNSGDHSTNGNSEVKPHIRWYPFPSTSNLQDIKNVSTQTSVSFIAKQQTDSPVQVSDQQINQQEIPSKAFGSNLGGDSSTVQLDKTAAEVLDDSNFPSTSTLSSKASAVAEKGTVNEKTKTSLSHYTHVTSEVEITATKNAYIDANQIADEVYLSNSVGRKLSFTESHLSHKSEVEKQENMPLLTHSTSCIVTSNKSAQHQPSAVLSDTRYDSDDSTYLLTKNIVSQPPSKYIFSGDLPSSFAKRRVGVGQCQTSPEPATSKFPRENFKIQLDSQTKETSNSSTENTEKTESVPHSYKFFNANHSNSEVSRFVSNQVDNEAASYDHTRSNFEQNLDDTVPLTTAYIQNGNEPIQIRYNASTIPLENIALNRDERVNGIFTNNDTKITDVISGVTNHFFHTGTNLSQLLSENHPFPISRQHQNSIIHKSHSDPLISSQNCKTNVACEENKIFLQSHLPSVSRKLDFELSEDSESDSCERIDCVEASVVKHSSIKDNSEFLQSQNSFNPNLYSEIASNSFIYERGSFKNKSQLPGMKITVQSMNLPHDTPKFISDSNKSLLKEQSYLSSRNKMDKFHGIQRSFEHSDVVDEVHQIPIENVLSRLNYSELNKRNYASIGIQVSQSISGLEKCSFCHKTKDSHLNCCLKKELFKTALNQTLSKRVPEMKSKSATSFCVYPSGCYCCCNKTLQEAFNFHRSEIVERIELRKKEVEEKCKKKFSLNAPLASQTKPKQPLIKLNLKPVTDLHEKPWKMSSNKENKRIKKSESSWKSTSSQKGRQKNLNKYNRIMSKIYSQTEE
ncbi:unnamed protein product [Larinioides sclopetarius]|uniref:Uncharacterized protein n=1 Tax=Larinioides sclopetarius TaxID=280406 RepID=A0AAV2A5X4_9ARAC